MRPQPCPPQQSGTVGPQRSASVKNGSVVDEQALTGRQPNSDRGKLRKSDLKRSNRFPLHVIEGRQKPGRVIQSPAVLLAAAKDRGITLWLAAGCFVKIRQLN